MSRSSLQDLSRVVSSFSRGPAAGNHHQRFFDPTGSNTITIPDRIEKNEVLYPRSIQSCLMLRFFDPIVETYLTQSGQKSAEVISCN